MPDKVIIIALSQNGIMNNTYMYLISYFYQASEFFYYFSKADEASVMSLIKERRMLHAITMHPVTDPVVMYKIHRYLTELELNKTFVETRTLQNAIKDMLPYLPDGKDLRQNK